LGIAIKKRTKNGLILVFTLRLPLQNTCCRCRCLPFIYSDVDRTSLLEAKLQPEDQRNSAELGRGLRKIGHDDPVGRKGHDSVAFG